jgi:replicative DNA helicase
VRFVVVDYLQRVPPAERHEKRTYEVGSVSSALKAVADQTGVALLTLCQLNREPELQKGRLPKIADLADSGQIERDADFVGLLNRDRAEAVGDATLFVAKQRDSELGSVPLTFNGPFCRFENRSILP